jgi:hypothetical protein
LTDHVGENPNLIASLKTRWRRGLAIDAAIIVLFLTLCLLFFWQVLTPVAQDRRWFAAGDFTDQFYAFRYFQSQELWRGRLPLWNPYTFGGSPFVADIQSAVFYPIGVLILLVFGRSGLPLVAVEIEAIIHYFLAGVFVYLLVKHLTGKRLAGLVSGIVYAFGSYLTSYPKLQLAILEGQTWVPLALLAVSLAAGAERRGRPRRSVAWLALGGVSLALSALAGHAQTFLLAAYTVVGYLIFAFFPVCWAANRRGKVGRAARMSILPVVTLGLGAAQLWPALEYMRLSTRAQIGFAKAGGGFLYSDLLALVLPGLRVIYVGILPLVLVFLALILKRRRERGRELVFWGLVALTGLILSLGRQTVLYTVFYLLAPGFNLFQGQERALQVFSLAIAILSGFGVAYLSRPMAHQVKQRYLAFCRVLRGATIGAAALVLLAYWGALNLIATPAGQVNDLLERSVLLLLLLGLSTLVLHLRLGYKMHAGRLAVLIVPLLVFDLFSLNQGHDLQRSNARDRFQATAPVAFLQSQPGPFRVWDDHVLPGNYGCVWGIEDTGGISPLQLQSYQDFWKSLPGERARWLLNVHYAITSQDSLPDGELVGEYSTPAEDFYFYRIRSPGPRAFVAHSVEVQPDNSLALQRLAAPDFDPTQTVVLDSDPALNLAEAGQATVRFVEREPSRLILDVDTSVAGILVLSEIDYPGWQATVDGQPVDVLRADTILRAVALPAGTHRVEMVFRSRAVLAGLSLSALMLLAVLVGVPYLARSDK